MCISLADYTHSIDCPQCYPAGRRARRSGRNDVDQHASGAQLGEPDRLLALFDRASEHINVESLQRRRIGGAQHHVVDSSVAQRRIAETGGRELRRGVQAVEWELVTPGRGGDEAGAGEAAG
jgi:hypothetical protein